MGEEVWTPVNGFENSYEVSSLSRIKSLSYRFKRRGINHVTKERIVSQSVLENGYSRVYIRGLGNTLTHRLVAMSFLENPSNKPTVNHKDGNKLNNKISNLEWATYSENNSHARDFHLKKGANCLLAKLNFEQAMTIKTCKGHDKITKKSLSLIYNTHIDNVNKIQKDKTWK